MGFFDKVKNMFIDDGNDDDVKVEQVRKEVTKVAIESPKVDTYDITDELTFDMGDEEKEETSFSRPVFFDDNDFKDLNLSLEKEEPKPIEKEIYVRKVETPKVEEKKIFKPTPIISPVYGVLDKNYHKEDIVDRKEVVHESVDGLSVDSIRNKAYGTLEDEIEDVMIAPQKKKVEVEEVEVDLFDEIEEIVKEKKVEEKPKKVVKEKTVKEIEEATIDLTQELDNLLLSKEKYNMVKDDEEITKEKDDSLSETDLFNLIDSMYEEGEED